MRRQFTVQTIHIDNWTRRLAGQPVNGVGNNGIPRMTTVQRKALPRPAELGTVTFNPTSGIHEIADGKGGWVQV